eukprot:9036862-Pyramimonas_sp.AAC.1
MKPSKRFCCTHKLAKTSGTKLGARSRESKRWRGLSRRFYRFFPGPPTHGLLDGPRSRKFLSVRKVGTLGTPGYGAIGARVASGFMLVNWTIDPRWDARGSPDWLKNS